MATVDDTISPRGSASVEDGRSLHSAASTSAWESVDGHDDATAPITNCTKAKASEIPDCGTIDSFVTQSLIADGSTDDRDDEKSNKELSPSLSISRDLKDQLNELDKRWHELEAKLPPTLSPSQNDKEASSPFESINEDAPTAEANESHQQPHSGNVNDTESPNSQMVATGTATSEIVRQVQKRLLSESNSSIGQQGLSQAFWTVNVDDLEGGQVDKPSETAKTLNSIESTTTWKLNLDDVEEVVEFEQTSTAGNTINSSGDEQSSQDNCKTTRQRSRWCFILIVILLLIAVILAIVFGTKEDSKSAPLDSNGSKGDQTLSPTDSPTVNPTAKPTIATMAPTTPPTANPTTKPTPSPTANPTTKPTSKPSSSLKPSYSDPVFNHLYSLSGDLLLDENTPQFKTYEWLLQDDPAYLNLLEIPLKDLEQRYVAALLYFSLNGDSWHTDFGFLGESPVCEWNNDSGEGIKCDSSRTIVGVTINNNNLSGPLPFELKALVFLKELQFRYNIINGSIPAELGDLASLEELDLRENELEGDVPESIFQLPMLKKLFLLRNSKLSGSIPSSIEKASSLEIISFYLCQITGSLPESIGTLSNLYLLTLVGNNLSGSLPKGLSRLPKLRVLELSGNSITGTIPDFAATQTDLYFVSLSGNKLTGSIPETIGSLRSLLFFDIRDNQIAESIPDSIGMLPRLVTLFASNNQLTGSLPSFDGNNGMLQTIDLSNNKLTGSVESFFAADGPEQLVSVNFESNQLNGSIPATIGAYTSLLSVSMAYNKLVGSLPQELGQLTALETLSLSHNNMYGNIPGSIGLLENLDELRLDHNQFHGNLDGNFCEASSNSQNLSIFTADCRIPSPEISCSCCTTCCQVQIGCVNL